MLVAQAKGSHQLEANNSDPSTAFLLEKSLIFNREASSDLTNPKTWKITIHLDF